MKSLMSMLVVLSLLIVSTAFAGDLELKPYGFVKGDMVFATNGVLSFGNNNLSAPQRASNVDHAAIGFTAQHTRFGLKGSYGENFKVGGRIELDFYGGGFDTNIKPRLRLAYAWMKKSIFELRIGQQWDVFSPINATTNNTNGNMWYTGNRGFRRAQIQAIITIPVKVVTPKIQVALGEASKEAAGLGWDNQSAIPMIQTRVSLKIVDKLDFGISGVFAVYEPRVDPVVEDDEFSTIGFCFDFNLPFSKLAALKGEVNFGKNLNNANMFNIAGNARYDFFNDEYLDMNCMGAWFNFISKPLDMLNFVVGAGIDKNTTCDDDILFGGVEQNWAMYGDLIFPFGHGFSLALETEYINTAIKGREHHNEALVFNVSGKVSF